ncbi:hypothetical protein [Daejeonella oryzae]|uniref:hypothetical protein n=1 Tax=Daejeonella oryzae TaxID=1122943 RepID=UPI00040A9399|nr:hypothetical protein [Daejeonella oryzae]
MTLSDQEFREEFKPLQVPAFYSASDSIENKIVYALAQVAEGSASEVIAKLEELEPGIENSKSAEIIREFLKDKFDKGLISGSKKDGSLIYNLNKITSPNQGNIDPDLLAPGLD